MGGRVMPVHSRPLAAGVDVEAFADDLGELGRERLGGSMTLGGSPRRIISAAPWGAAGGWRGRACFCHRRILIESEGFLAGCVPGIILAHPIRRR